MRSEFPVEAAGARRDSVDVYTNRVDTPFRYESANGCDHADLIGLAGGVGGVSLTVIFSVATVTHAHRV